MSWAWAKVGWGVFFFLLGLGYLYQPSWIERLYAFMREYLLNDAHLALERRKWGLFFLLLSSVFLYYGYVGLYGEP